MKHTHSELVFLIKDGLPTESAWRQDPVHNLDRNKKISVFDLLITIEKMYIDDGHAMSASTVAAPYKNLIITGNVMDSHFLVLKRDR